jgi:hypothetical protein
LFPSQLNTILSFYTAFALGIVVLKTVITAGGGELNLSFQRKTRGRPFLKTGSFCGAQNRKLLLCPEQEVFALP